MFRSIVLLMLVSLFSLVVQADDAKEVERIKSKLIEALPGYTPDEVSKSPVAGLYEVIYGTQVIYITENGRYILQGTLIDIENGNRNLTEVAESKARKKYLSQVQAQESISFGAQQPKHTITVFTDIDCGYCRKLHAEMDQYASYGIKVNYLLFPRSGVDTESYHKAVSVWCSDDRASALTRAKQGGKVAKANCDHPVAEHLEMGGKVGVTGTPAILTADGELMPGYMPAKQLADSLGRSAKN